MLLTTIGFLEEAISQASETVFSLKNKDINKKLLVGRLAPVRILKIKWRRFSKKCRRNQAVACQIKPGEKVSWFNFVHDK